MHKRITDAEIAKRFGVSRERISYQHRQALKKLRAAILRDPVLSRYVREEIAPDAGQSNQTRKR